MHGIGQTSLTASTWSTTVSITRAFKDITYSAVVALVQVCSLSMRVHYAVGIRENLSADLKRASYPATVSSTKAVIPLLKPCYHTCPGDNCLYVDRLEDVGSKQKPRHKPSTITPTPLETLATYPGDDLRVNRLQTVCSRTRDASRVQGTAQPPVEIDRATVLIV